MSGRSQSSTGSTPLRSMGRPNPIYKPHPALYFALGDYQPSSGIAGSRRFENVEELHSRVNDAILRIDENSVMVLKNLRSRGEKHDAHRQRV